jgi:regulatory protein YycI of two-component signal transduction system YycFG
MIVIFIILLITLNISVLLLIFLNPKPLKEINTKEQNKPQESQEPQNLVQQDSLLNKVYREEVAKKLR